MNEVLVREEPQVPMAVSPMTLVQMAVQQGAPVDQLERLMALAERHEANEAKKAFVAALAKFKENPPEVIKNIKVSFGNTKYSHAGLDQASEKIGAALSLVDISHTWDVQQGERIKVTCILTHKLGHSERVSMEGMADTSGSKSALQAIASAISFMQRYTLLMAVGVAPKNVDDDARGGTGPKELDARVKGEYIAQIAACQKVKETEALLQTIAAECTRVGDVAGYEELKLTLAAKRKELKASEPKGAI